MSSLQSDPEFSGQDWPDLEYTERFYREGGGALPPIGPGSCSKCRERRVEVGSFTFEGFKRLLL
jgi:hypothetical protein